MRRIVIILWVLGSALYTLFHLIVAVKDYSEVPQFLKDLSESAAVRALAADSIGILLLLLAALGVIYLTATVETPVFGKLMQWLRSQLAFDGEMPAKGAAMTPRAEVARDASFQHAAFYAAFGYWPDSSKSIFDGNECQIPEGEHKKLLESLQKMRQSAADGEFTVWGKAPSSFGGPRQNSVFQKIPETHWLDHAVDYMELLRADPSLMRTSKDHEYSADAWCALQVSKAQVERLWPAEAQGEPPLKILIGNGAPYDEYRLDEHGRHHTLNALLYNGGNSRIDGVKLYRTFVPEGASPTQKVLLCGPVSLAPRQRHPVAIAGYNEAETVAKENRRIVLAAPSAGFNTSTMLAPGRYSVMLEADSIDGLAFKANCRLWVDMGNVLRLEKS